MKTSLGQLKAGSYATSAGDLRDAPFPDGATELVDLDTGRARERGVRFAVMVVNAYSGLPFGLLERAFAGVMLREDLHGAHFAPRTVELKFELAGENGVYLPLVLDLAASELHWLDVHAKGELEYNNVERSSLAITTICPETMLYFESGVRASMLDLALLHAAARTERIFLRSADGTTRLFKRRPGEEPAALHARLAGGDADEPRSRPLRADAGPALALLFRGDVELPAGSDVYALFREGVVPTLAAADLLS